MGSGLSTEMGIGLSRADVVLPPMFGTKKEAFSGFLSFCIILTRACNDILLSPFTCEESEALEMEICSRALLGTVRLNQVL